MDHEPCKSRGDCYHVRAARKMHETWGKTSEAREARSRGGRIGGPIGGRTNVERRTDFAALGRIGGPIGGPIGGRTQGRRNVESGYIASLGRIQGRKNAESGHIQVLGRTQGRRNVESGHLARIASLGGVKTLEILRQKPNRQEATVAALFMTFHPDVWADIIWQRPLQDLRGVPDLRHPVRVIGEYDGDGHHIFYDRSARDTAKDAERRAAGYVVIRETNPYVLVEKFAFAVKEVA